MPRALDIDRTRRQTDRQRACIAQRIPPLRLPPMDWRANPESEAGGRRAGGRRGDSLAIAERIGLWYQPKESTRFGPFCRWTGERTPRARPAEEEPAEGGGTARSEEHTSELQSLRHLVCRLLLEKKKKQ